MIIKNKLILFSVFAFVVLSVALLFVYILPQFSSSDSNRSTNSIDNIIYGTKYSLDLTDQDKQWLAQHPIIRLGIDRAFPPFGSITSDNEYIGFSADFMRMIEYRLKIKFDIAKDAPWGKTMEMAEAGELDMISALVNTEARQQFLEFTEPYAHNPTIIINDGLNKGHLRSLKNLKGKQVAIEKGSYAAAELSRKYPEISLILVKNTKNALSLVSSGLADAYVGNAVTASYLIKKYHYNNLSFSGQTEYSSDHSIGIVKSNVILAGIMKKALASISEEDRGAISNHWFGMEIHTHISMNKLISIGSALIGTLLLLLAWAIFLRKTRNQLKRSQQLLKKEAEEDHLTGLDNRRKFYQMLETEIENSKATNKSFALFYLDLDRFKEINDSLGHAIGDLLLVEVSKRIQSCVEDSSKIARLGGDEFMIILSGVPDKKLIERTARCIKGSLNMPFDINDHEIVISTSTGITCYPDDATTVGQLINNGDQAMYHSKKSGRNCFSYFNHTMKQATELKNRTMSELRLAVQEEQFVLHYQPIIDFSSNKICKAEALIRWNHPDRGVISPDEFIPLAEEAGLINEIGVWTFKEAVSETVKIQSILDNEFQMSINTSPLQYCKNGMDIANWYSYLRSYGLSGKNLVMEITEGILMEPSATVMSNLFQLRDLGIQIAIDDFGTGYSSLSYLKKFDIDFLKIDQSFVRSLTIDSDEMALVQAMIIMAHKLGCKVIAEGIETKSQRDILINAGCDYGQGYYYSKPIAANEFEHLIRQWDNNNEDGPKKIIPFKRGSDNLTTFDTP
jgi:diguanylate cyclase (GGDEF)-like protein